MTRRRLALLLAALLLAMSGCDRIRAALEERQELTAEQRAIQAYSDATPHVNQAQQRFVQAWEQAVKNEKVEPLREAIEKTVDPALEEYLAALREMPTSTPDLQRIHGLIVSAYGKLQVDVKTFREALNEENRKEPVDALIAQLDDLTKAEDAYRRELKGYYEKHNITLVLEKNEATEDGAEGPSTGATRAAPPTKPALEPAPQDAAAPSPTELAPPAGASAPPAGAGAQPAADPAPPAPAPSAPPTEPAAAPGDAKP